MSLIKVETPQGQAYIAPKTVVGINSHYNLPEYCVVSRMDLLAVLVKGSPDEVHALLFGAAPEVVSKAEIRAALEREWCMFYGMDTDLAAGVRYGLLLVAARIGVPYRTDFGPSEAARIAEEGAIGGTVSKTTPGDAGA